MFLDKNYNREMQVYHNFDEITRNVNSVVTVGTFDGVHLGHMKIIDRLKEVARKENMRPVLLTIYPHPRIVLQKPVNGELKLITTMEERKRVFASLGIEHLLIVPFTKEFAKTPPESFVKDYLHGKVGMKKILIGHDHMFGRDREGNEDLLRRLGNELDFSIEKIGPYQEGDTVISSSKIRKAVQNHEVEFANKMLGYNFFVCGKVVRGDGRGRALGVPTANIKPQEEHKLMPGNGVYFVRSEIHGKQYYGMSNLGFRPTFKDEKELVLEVNYFDFDKDIYDDIVAVEFLRFIRNEKKFSGPEELKAQLDKDRQDCMNLINKYEK